MSRERILMFLYGNRNIAGSILGLCGLALFFSGIIRSYWLPIVLGLYAIGYLAAPRSRHCELHMSQRMSADEIRASLDELLEKVRHRAPQEVVQRVTSIKESITAILPRISNLNASSDRNVFTIRQTALDYLPRSLESYLNLPRAYARLHRVKEGKTPHQIILQQLEILDDKMKEIVVNFYEEDTLNLLANGRFLEEQFLRQRTFEVSS